jgi:hypothetical protein
MPTQALKPDQKRALDERRKRWARPENKAAWQTMFNQYLVSGSGFIADNTMTPDAFEKLVMHMFSPKSMLPEVVFVSRGSDTVR